MKVINRTDFMKLPAGTAFCKGKPWYFGSICFKGDTLDTPTGDWGYYEPAWVDAGDSGEAFDRLEEMLQLGKSYPMEDASGRDGCFDMDDLFLIFERADLEALKSCINDAIGVA